MENETQILIKQLIKAVDSPDWWTIGITSAITIINAAIMVWLGVNQYKLQKRQAEAQEYDVYRRLYILLSNANSEIDNFLGDLEDVLYAPRFHADEEYLQRKLTHIERLKSDLRKSYIDFELKFSNDTFNKDGYRLILTQMSFILRHIIKSLEDKSMCLSEGVQEITYTQGNEDEAFASLIVKRFNSNLMQDFVYKTFEKFIYLKRTVRCDDSLLESIRAKCKID